MAEDFQVGDQDVIIATAALKIQQQLLQLAGGTVLIGFGGAILKIVFDCQSVGFHIFLRVIHSLNHGVEALGDILQCFRFNSAISFIKKIGKIFGDFNVLNMVQETNDFIKGSSFFGAVYFFV